MERVSLTEIVDRAILSANLPRGCRLLAGVSGGPDSVALLDALERLSHRPDAQWTLKVGHVHHGLRGADADADETFVAHLAEERGLEFESRRTDAAAHARVHGLSLEAASREIRYRVLYDMLQQWPGDMLAAGHTEDDQAETVVLHLLRGAGLQGLSGMKLRRDRLVRPFLTVSHEALLAYLQHRAVGYRLDATNTDPKHARNRLRLEILPILRRSAPSASHVLARAAMLLQIDGDLLRRETDAAMRALNARSEGGNAEADRRALLALHPALARGVLRSMITACVGDPGDFEFKHVALIEKTLREYPARAALTHQLPRGLEVHCTEKRFTLRMGLQDSPTRFSPVRFQIPGEARFGNATLRATISDDIVERDLRYMNVVRGPNHALLDAEAVGSEFTVRSRRPGDTMRPTGAPGSRKLQDILVDRKVASQARDLVPVVEDSRGIVWLAGLAVDNRATWRPGGARTVHLIFEPR